MKLDPAMSDAERDALWSGIVSGSDVSVEYPPYQPGLMKAWCRRASTDEEVLALDRTCEPWSVDHLFPALSSSQVEVIKRARLVADVALTSEHDVIVARRRRFYFFMKTAIAPSEWSAMAELDHSSLMEPGYAVTSLEYPELRTRLVSVANEVRAWLAPQLAQTASLFSPSGATNEAALWAATLAGPTDPSISSAATQLRALKGAFASLAEREQTAAGLARVLVEALDPAGTLASLRAGNKDKNVLAMYDAAATQLAANQGPSPDFPAMDPVAASALLLASGDARKVIAEALDGADQVRTFAILLAVAQFLPNRYPDMLGHDGWSWIERILVQLDRVATSALDAASFARAWKLISAALTKPKYTSAPLTDAALTTAVCSVRDRATSEYVRALLDGVLQAR